MCRGCEGVCSVRECIVCVRVCEGMCSVCEGACTKVQCVYKWCVRECGYNGCVYRGFSEGCEGVCSVCEGVRAMHRGGWCALHCVEWQECDKKIYVCRLDVCDKGVCSGWMCTRGMWGRHAVHPLHNPSHTPCVYTPSHTPSYTLYTYTLYTHSLTHPHTPLRNTLTHPLYTHHL